MSNLDALTSNLAKHGQEQLLTYWEELDEEQGRLLTEDIEELNLEEVNEFFKRATSSLEDGNAKLDDKMEPVCEDKFLSISRTDEDQLKKFKEEGLKQISESKVGVLLMAGGQGTRLGFAHPKGMFNVGLPSNKSLFRIQGERILKLQRLAAELTGNSGRIAWYIMTSEHTMIPTKKYFEQNNYFGLNAEDIIMFEQGSLPCYDFDGKILLDEKHRVSKAPDGNGGLYRALRDRGILDDMERRGVLYLHAHSVDNILIKVADPVSIGYFVEQKADCGAKVVEKSHPNEAVGVVCQVDGKYQVVEYSEITQKTAELRKEDGRLVFNAGNICNHFFATSFLRKIGSTFEKNLKLHVAKKKIPFVDSTGTRCTPDKPNGIKIEKFVFDVFEFAEHFVTIEVPRDEEFSALKNADSVGKDCASTARADIYRLHRKYIEGAGGTIEGAIFIVNNFASKRILSKQHPKLHYFKMIKLVIISSLIVAACCMVADKDKTGQLELSETTWNSAWANPANPTNPNAAWGGNSWNSRWNSPNADPRWNRWGAEPWNRQWGGANTAGWNQWNRAGSAWPAAGAPAGAAAATRGGWNTW